MLGHKDEDNERLPRVVESLLGRDISMAACGVVHTIALSVSPLKPPHLLQHPSLKLLSNQRHVYYDQVHYVEY